MKKFISVILLYFFFFIAFFLFSSKSAFATASLNCASPSNGSNYSPGSISFSASATDDDVPTTAGQRDFYFVLDGLSEYIGGYYRGANDPPVIPSPYTTTRDITSPASHSWGISVNLEGALIMSCSNSFTIKAPNCGICTCQCMSGCDGGPCTLSCNGPDAGSVYCRGDCSIACSAASCAVHTSDLCCTGQGICGSPPTPCADAGGTCSVSQCAPSDQYNLADCPNQYCCLPQSFSCADQGGYCAGSCGTDTNLGTGSSDCGGWNCCVTPPATPAPTQPPFPTEPPTQPPLPTEPPTQPPFPTEPPTQPPSPTPLSSTCADNWGSCYSGGCPDVTYTNLGTAFPDCGGWSCCVPLPPAPTCTDVGGICKTTCGAGETAQAGTTGCGLAESCCLPIGVTVSINVFNDLNRNMARDVGETGASAVPIVVRLFGSGINLYTAITDLNGRHSFNNIPKNMYTVIITVPSGYEVVGGINSKNINGFVSSINVTFPIAPLGRVISDSLTVIADTATSAVPTGIYGMTGLRLDDPTLPKGQNYYNPIKITQKIDVTDKTNRDKVALIGVAFVDPFGAVPTTLSSLVTKADSGGGFILISGPQSFSVTRFIANNLGTTLSTCSLGYYFCPNYYYLYVNHVWNKINASTTLFSGSVNIDRTTAGIKLNAGLHNNVIPTTFPNVISIPFTTYMFKTMGSKQWATYGFMYDSDGIQYVRRQKACDGSGNCTAQ